MMSTINSDSSIDGLERKKKVSFEKSIQSGLFTDKELNSILMEHCYSRPHNRMFESRFLRPTKTLFIQQKSVSTKKSTNPLAPLQDCDDNIDIEALPIDPPMIYDLHKAKFLMEECERYVSVTRTEEDFEWEEKINRTNWLSTQNRLFQGIVKILTNDYTARQAYEGVYNEPILRRNIIDKSVQRFRQLMTNLSWDTKLLQWLHGLLIENLSKAFLAIYFDILQTLKSKVPSAVEKLLYGPMASNRVGITSNESLYSILKRPWDPVAPSLNQDKPKKLPGNPIIIVIPSSPVGANSNHLKRLHRWINLLSNLATIFCVYTNIGSTVSRMTMINCLDQMFAATRTKIQEVKEEYPGRSIIIAGFNAGASIALQVAQVEPILCVLCLGFSLLTAEGIRGDPDDNLLELQCPVLFVIGECSNTSLQEDMEDLRERMRVETGLIIVGSADDYLRVNKKKKRMESISQSVVDRCIVDEVGEFVSGLLLSPYPPQIRQSPSHVPDGKFANIERKRSNSNGSSVDSEPPSPTHRITRPVGRPPGPKAKFQSKWTLQVPQGITPKSPSISPPVHTANLSDSNTHDSNTHTEKPVPKLSLQSETSSTNSVTIPASVEKSSDDIHLKESLEISGANTGIGLKGSHLTSQDKQATSGIRVLENLSLNSSAAGKFVSNTGRAIDLSKITILNTVNQPKPGNSCGNIVIMSDGKIKNANSTVRGTGCTPLMFPSTNKDKIPIPVSTTMSAKSKISKYITSKKQLMGTKPPKPVKKISYMSTPSSVSQNLSLPTNLTSEDIMDLPIIFADDNQMLTNNVIQPTESSSSSSSQIVTQTSSTKSSNSGKIVFINKQIPVSSTANIISPVTLKRHSIPISMRTGTNSVKYTKIILSKRSSGEDSKGSNSLTILPPEISLKKIESQALNDIESQLVGTPLLNPNFKKQDTTQNTEILKKHQDEKLNNTPIHDTVPQIFFDNSRKRSNVQDNEDVDSVPIKSTRLDEKVTDV